VLRFGNLPQVTTAAGPLSANFAAALDSDGYLVPPLDTTEPGSVVWRGPLRPFPPPPRSNGVAVRSAPEEWDKVPANTKLDYSHATAFELGKLLALADAGIREDLREVHKHFNIPNKYFVAVNQLPAALQRPYWGIDQGDTLPDAQNQLNQALNQALGSQQSMVGISAAPGQGDFTGVGAIATANGWEQSVAAELNLVASQAGSQVATPAQLAQIDATVTDAALKANLEQQFPELIGAAV
jgi:hypothetical protein